MNITLDRNQSILHKSLLWVGIISIVMFFAGLTSAVVVSKTSGNWVSYQIPSVFLISTLLIVTSSFTYQMGLKLASSQSWNAAKGLFVLTGILGVFFMVAQFYGWSQLVAQGIFATGVKSNVSASYFYLIVFLHLLHFVAAMISWAIVTVKTFKNRYTHGVSKIEVSVLFWHFLTGLWVYVFFFLQNMIQG
ncbi:MAG: heme-copper oxidase subunit III [Flavobacteriaceae bacterium]|nr:heme-copper oxidase subunit III [Flavobacteriaceae bacterium]